MSFSERSNHFAQVFPLLGRDLQAEVRFFNQLLVPALNGAFALAERHHIAVLVSQYLKLNVARPLNEFLHVHVAVAERIGGLCTRPD